MEILKYTQGLKLYYNNIIKTENIIREYFDKYFESFKGVPLKYKSEVIEIASKEEDSYYKFFRIMTRDMDLFDYQKIILINLLKRGRT